MKLSAGEKRQFSHKWKGKREGEGSSFGIKEAFKTFVDSYDKTACHKVLAESVHPYGWRKSHALLVASW